MRVAGSYRDPGGHVFTYGERILRTVHGAIARQFAKIESTGVVQEAVDHGFLVSTHSLASGDIPAPLRHADIVLEHQPIAYISYPYEWGFSQLKAAALHHLDFQLFLLKRGAILKDASAYNIQFKDSKPIFIDALSIDVYKQGQFWQGHEQFCAQFLNPLLLWALRGVAPNAWYRGSLEGLSSMDLSRLLSFKDKLSWTVMTQVVLHARLQRFAIGHTQKTIHKIKQQRPLAKHAYQGQLRQLRNYIAKLRCKALGPTVWQDYAWDNTYEDDETKKKHQLVTKFCKQHCPTMLLDLGCNAGHYSLAALKAGARFVVGYDFDHKAIEKATARGMGKAFLPLWFDAANPSPAQGWRQQERFGFAQRSQGQAVMALAFVHHLAIARNIPLHQVVEWIVSLAPHGLIEFVEKTDPTVQKMLSLREDIFADYSKQSFEQALKKVAHVRASTVVSKSGRRVYNFQRR